MTLKRLVLFALAAGLFAWGGWWLVSPRLSPIAVQQPEIPPSSNQPITPIPRHVDLDERKAELGWHLFHEPRLSHDDSISCASCHDLNKAGGDARPRAVGIGGHVGELNSPTVLNSSFNFRQFWDGRAATLEEQIQGHVYNLIEMGSNWQEVVAKLERDADYPRAFRAIWPDGITAAHIQSAIAEYERGLITPDAPFDRFLRGDAKALNREARVGWKLFSDLGCIACHQGVNIGGNMYANLGVMGDFFADLARPALKSDLGRYNVTGREEDRYLFKVPTLRNVADTAPYFQDGSIPTLNQAVEIMARYQLGVTLNAGDCDALAAFLRSLSGTLREPAP